MKYGEDIRDSAPSEFRSWPAFFRSLDLEDLKMAAQNYEKEGAWPEALSFWNAMQLRLDKLANTTPSFNKINPRYGQDVIDGIARCQNQLGESLVPSVI